VTTTSDLEDEVVTPGGHSAGAKSGAWTLGRLLGAALVADATDARVTVNGGLT
jgi:hypothetical protein